VAFFGSSVKSISNSLAFALVIAAAWFGSLALVIAPWQ
jgi:hypothetical protein